jgi:hypothetical protein
LFVKRRGRGHMAVDRSCFLGKVNFIVRFESGGLD